MPIKPENRARYPADWSTVIVPRIAARAGGRCECRGECGRTPCHLGTDGRCMNRQGESAWLTHARVVLTTAHRDHTPENCDDDNLFHACQGCHLSYDRDHHAATARRTRMDRKAAGDLFYVSPRPKEGSMQDDKQHENAAAEANKALPVGPDPSIGRVVWYYPSKAELKHPSYAGQPHSAQIACVHSNACVNLGIIDSNGEPYARTSVILYHPDGVPEWQSGAGHYATWMPFQVK